MQRDPKKVACQDQPVPREEQPVTCATASALLESGKRGSLRDGGLPGRRVDDQKADNGQEEERGGYAVLYISEEYPPNLLVVVKRFHQSCLLLLCCVSLQGWRLLEGFDRLRDFPVYHIIRQAMMVIILV
jgi:hypothetical protein